VVDAMSEYCDNSTIYIYILIFSGNIRGLHHGTRGTTHHGSLNDLSRNYNNRGSDNTEGNNSNDRNGQNRRRNECGPMRPMGFKALEEMSLVDTRDILAKINQKNDSFMNRIKSSIEDTDVFVIIVEILAKICNSSFDELKLRLLLEVCNSPFILNLRNCLMELPYDRPRHNNRKYWNDPNKFWNNFIIFGECIFNMAPSVALQKCRTLLEGASKCCLEGMRERYDFNLTDENHSQLTKLRERLASFEKSEVCYLLSLILYPFQNILSQVISKENYLFFHNYSRSKKYSATDIIRRMRMRKVNPPRTFGSSA
jgi:hypothetical protein